MTAKTRQHLESGLAALATAKSRSESANATNLRVGSAGVVIDGEVYGTCHRKALARQLGVEEQVGLPTHIMWEGGLAYESGWNRALAGVGKRDVELRVDIPGVPAPLVGHPDLVLDGVGIEHKGVFSYSTAAQVWFESRPKNENLIQAATYSHFLNMPFELWYTSASYYSIPNYDKARYGGGSIKPFYKGFALTWRMDGRLLYTPEDGETVVTQVTGERIADFYRLVSEMPVREDLGPRPTATYLDGTPNKWGTLSACEFCPFKGSCDQYDRDKDYKQWIDNITEAIKP